MSKACRKEVSTLKRRSGFVSLRQPRPLKRTLLGHRVEAQVDDCLMTWGYLMDLGGSRSVSRLNTFTLRRAKR